MQSYHILITLSMLCSWCALHSSIVNGCSEILSSHISTAGFLLCIEKDSDIVSLGQLRVILFKIQIFGIIQIIILFPSLPSSNIDSVIKFSSDFNEPSVGHGLILGELLLVTITRARLFERRDSSIGKNSSLYQS